MTTPQIIQQIEAAGGVLTLNGDRIQYDLPKDARALVGTLRVHREEVLRFLQKREQPKRCKRHGIWAKWWTLDDGSQVCGMCHPDPYTLAVKETRSSAPPVMPEGVCLLAW